MKLTETQTKLIQNALKNLDTRNQKLLFNFIVKHAEQNEWFIAKLIAVLTRGVTFIIKPIESFAQYTHPKRQIILNSQYVQTVASEEMLFSAFMIALRHELTHSVDYAMFDENLKDLLIKELDIYANAAKILYQQLSCIQQNYQVNTKALDQLSSLMHQSPAIAGQLEFISMNATATRLWDISLRFLGTASDQNHFGTVYTTQLWSGDGEVNPHGMHAITYDPMHALELFNQTSVIRRQNGLQSLESVFHQFFDRKLHDLFATLSKKQRQTLNTLFVIRARILSNIAQDPVCFSALKSCISASDSNTNENCFDVFLKCQASLPTTDHIQSHFEIHACLQERADIHKLRDNILEQLCRVTPLKTLINPLVEIKEAHQQKSAESAAICLGLNSVAYSFIDELATSYVQKNRLTHPRARVLLINIAYASTVGLLSYLTSDKETASVMLQIAVPVILTIFNNSLKNIKSHNVVRHPLTAITFATQFMMSGTKNALIGLASGVAGNSLGHLVGRSMSRWLGWKRSASNMVLQIKNDPPTAPKVAAS